MKPWPLLSAKLCFPAVIFILAVCAFGITQAVGLISVTIDQLVIPLESKTDTTEKSAQSTPPVFLTVLKLDKLHVTMDISSDPVVFQLSLEDLKLPEPYQYLRHLQFSCQSLDIQPGFIDCLGKKLSIAGLFPGQTTASSDFSLHYSFMEQQLSLNIKDIQLGGGKLSLTYQLSHDQWQVTFNAEQLKFNTFKSYFKYYYPDFIRSLSDAGFSLTASGSLKGRIAEQAGDKTAGLKQFKIKGKIRQLHYSYASADSDNQADKVSFYFNYELNKKSHNNSEMTLALSHIQGELLQNDIYLAFTGKQKIYLKLLQNIKNKTLKFKRIKITSDKLLDIEASALVKLQNKPEFRNFHIAYTFNDLQSFNKQYLKNMLDGTDYEGLQIQGGLKGYFGKSAGKLQLNTVFNDFYLDFNNQIAVDHLTGELNWNNHKSYAQSPVSELLWQELQLNKLPFGKTQLKFVAYSDQIKLLQETDIPLFDGALHINSLDISKLGLPGSDQDKSTGMTISIDGLIKPVSLKLVSEHFNWPILNGKLSAVIPKTRYNSHLLTVGGAMMMRVFDGTIIFKDLKIIRPLGDNAVFYANIDLMNLDLQALTKTFNFGEIEGRLEGRIRDLELYNWSPVAFNAAFKTPENDHSRHRISQRAIDNLSSLGGASGILSRSFLSFFKTFRYDRIGLSCRLKNNTCYMNGIEPKGKNAYYIVKGSGLPRIDVLGFQKAVNWKVLITRLENIQSANEAVIE